MLFIYGEVTSKRLLLYSNMPFKSSLFTIGGVMPGDSSGIILLQLIYFMEMIFN